MTQRNMPHYICKGEGCDAMQDKPSVCLEPTCNNRYKLLEECNCPHKESHAGEIEMRDKNPVAHTLNVIHFGVAFGVVGGVFVFLLGIASILGFGREAVELFSTFYIGYESTLLGSLAGGLWAFVESFAGGVIIAWVYNIFQKVR